MRMIPLIALAVASGAMAQEQKADKPGMGFRDTPMLPGGKWHVHDPDRPAPKVVTPAAQPGGAPSDAVVLFDGRSMEAWTPSGKPWVLKDGAMTVPPRDG